MLLEATKVSKAFGSFWAVAGADLVVTVGLLLSTAGLEYPTAPLHGALPVTATWMAGPVLAWAVRYGRRAGTIVAVIIALCDFLLQRKVALSAIQG